MVTVTGGEALRSQRLWRWWSAGQVHSFRGHELHYWVEGEGPPLLLLHGYPTASWGWHRMWGDLTARCRVITLDLLGSGFSVKPADGDYSVASLAEQCEDLLRYLGIDTVDVLAHAYGVTTAQELLARHLEREGGGAPRLRSVSFINGGLFPEGMHPTRTQRLLIGPLGPFVARFAPQPYRLFRDKLARNFGPGRKPAEEELNELWELMRFNQGQRVVPRVLQYLRERQSQRERWVGALQRADIPLQLINGAADPVVGADTPALWRRYVPHGDLAELPDDVGHYPPLEAPRETFAAYSDFRDQRLGPRAV